MRYCFRLRVGDGAGMGNVTKRNHSSWQRRSDMNFCHCHRDAVNDMRLRSRIALHCDGGVGLQQRYEITLSKGKTEHHGFYIAARFANCLTLS
jgi:hypothetical protein